MLSKTGRGIRMFITQSDLLNVLYAAYSFNKDSMFIINSCCITFGIYTISYTNHNTIVFTSDYNIVLAFVNTFVIAGVMAFVMSCVMAFVLSIGGRGWFCVLLLFYCFVFRCMFRNLFI